MCFCVYNGPFLYRQLSSRRNLQDSPPGPIVGSSRPQFQRLSIPSYGIAFRMISDLTGFSYIHQSVDRPFILNHTIVRIAVKIDLNAA